MSHWTKVVRDSILVLSLLAVAAPAAAQAGGLQTSHVSTDAAALSAVESGGGAFRFTGEARLGREGNKDWELGFRRHPAVLNDGTQVTAQFDSWAKDVPVSFQLAYSAATHRATLTLTRGTATGTVTTKSTHNLVGDFNELFVRVRARKNKSSIVAQGLVLDGVAIADRAIASIAPGGDDLAGLKDGDDDDGHDKVDVLRIRGGSLADGFVLTGTLTLSWKGSSAKGDDLDAQLWAAKVPGGAPADTTAPVAAILVPAQGAILPDSTPAFRSSYTDAGAGIDPASVRLQIDGVDRTAELRMTPTGASFTPAVLLAEGAHTAVLSVRDLAGNLATVTRPFTTDSVQPLLSFLSPSTPVSPGDLTPDVEIAYSDATSGVKLDTVRVGVDGTDLTPGCTVGPAGARCKVPVLTTGVHLISAMVVDRAGNARDTSAPLELLPDVTAPQVTITSPADGSLVNTALLHVTGIATDASTVTFVRANGVDGTLSGDTFQVDVPLNEGVNDLFVKAADASENEGTARRTVRLDRTPPVLKVETPSPGERVNQPGVRVAGTVADENGITAFTVNGLPVPVTDGSFETEITVAAGDSVILVRAVDGAENASQTSVPLTRFAIPSVSIETPEDLATINATTVDVTGSLDSPGLAVKVNGIAASVSGTHFTARDVPLIEGGNILTAVATAASGSQGTDSVNVVRDLTPPRVAVQYPAAGATVFEPTLTVTGLANDIVAGTVNAAEVAVTVNGRPAQVRNRSFAVDGVPLTLGDNTLTVVAVDEAGNTSQVTATVRRGAPGVRRLAVVSGNGQQARIGTELAAPLVVALLDATGQPVAGRKVVFEVLGNDGHLDGGRRQLAVSTDAAGHAEVRFSLGRRAGALNQAVEASCAGFAGPAVFLASAQPGDPDAIVVDAGDQQVGIAGQALPRPLVATVIDAGHNRLEGVAVRFSVVLGGGSFPNGQRELTLPTDSDGRVITPFLLDAKEGVAGNVVEAAIVSLPDRSAASFVATGLAAGAAAQTSVSGVVLDNENQPLEGVSLRVLDSPLTATTDAQGLFKIAGAPVGTVKLIVDGSTATRPGPWPDLEFVLTTVPGRDNTVNMPIYLVPLAVGAGLPVDETHGGVVRLPQIPGFALEIAPGSVTFPGGGRSGLVSVTIVHSDKVPMVPNFGQQPRFIVTIQPAGARFEPPARLTLPNVEGLAPGEVTEFYSFDHDLGHFVSIGPATVSEDGSLVTSNPGVGIVKAGWHCGGNSSSSGTTHNCPQCLKCENEHCVPDNGAACDDHDDCTVNDHCSGSSCTGDRRKITSATAKGNGSTSPEVYITKDVNFSVDVQGEHCSGGDLTYQWNFGDGKTGTGANPTHKYDKPGSYNAQVTVKCKTCDTKTGSVTVTVKCPKVKITRTDPAISILCPGCTMQFFAEVDPPEFTAKFKLVSGAGASITEAGLLSIASSAPGGNVVVKATVTDDGMDCFDQRSIFVFVPPSVPRRPNGRTEAEMAWARSNPICAIRNYLSGLQSECEAEMIRRFPNPAQQRDPNVGNAFLHAYCNCLTAQRCGVDAAKGLWDAHEQYDRNTCQYSGMDFNNNEVGRQVSSAAECSAAVLGALGAGRLRWMDPPPAPGSCSQFKQ
jgi:hypothetical protein